MDFLSEIWSQIGQYISIPYLLTFVLLAYLLKRYNLSIWKRIFKKRWKTVYSVLFLATAVAIPYLIWTEISWIQILFSYALGTSLHELIFRYIEKLWTKK